MFPSVPILQVNTSDNGGGAECVALSLHKAYQERGIDSWVAVGRKETDDQRLIEIPNEASRSCWTRVLRRAERTVIQRGKGRRGIGPLSGALAWLAEPRRHWDSMLGYEDYHFPGSRQLLQLCPRKPELIHCHNLHGNYFDLRMLPIISWSVPTVLTLHDAWLLAGHCAHSFTCDRWETGCGACPDITIPKPINRDASAENWRRKRDIYQASRLWVTAPSQWIIDRMRASILLPGVVSTRVIPNGVDRTIFRTAEQRTIREQLHLPQDSRILLFAATGAEHNRWKDYRMLRQAVSLVTARRQGQRLLLLVLGTDAPKTDEGRSEVRGIPYVKDQRQMAAYYQAADLYVHAAKADVCPLVILEAMACGTPVVATAVGGIPEQVVDGVTGFLIPAGDAETMATRICMLLDDEPRRLCMATAAAERARTHFDLQIQVQATLDLYGEALDQWRADTAVRSIPIGIQ